MHQTNAANAVLIVEDEVLIAMHLSIILEEAGFEVVGVAPDAAVALEMAAVRPPLVALVDIRLASGSDGVDLALQLRRLYKCAILFLSGSAERATLDRTREVEGAMFLQKPVEPEILVQHLHRLLPRFE